jgi:hypothetical protein
MIIIRARSSSISFRDGLVGSEVSGETGPDKIPRSVLNAISSVNTSKAVKLKVLIPEISAKKLMKFDESTVIGDIVNAMIQKHRFTEQSSSYDLFRKSENQEEILEFDKTILFYGLKDMVIYFSFFMFFILLNFRKKLNFEKKEKRV